MCWNKSDANLALTQDEARCKGVLLLPSGTVTSAPCSNSRRTVSELPENAARCKGVELVLSRTDTSAPYLINSRTVSAFKLDFTSSAPISCGDIRAVLN